MWITGDSLYIANETRVPASYAKHARERAGRRIVRTNAHGDFPAT